MILLGPPGLEVHTARQLVSHWGKMWDPPLRDLALLVLALVLALLRSLSFSLSANSLRLGKCNGTMKG